MNRAILIFTVLGMTSGCASAPHYEKMPTVAERFANDEDVKPGMALTSHGAVVDIKVEEVQAQKDRLERENGELKEQIKRLNDDLNQEREKVTVLKMSVNPPRVPASVEGE
jgi:predicted nuclease with TOPRIM domain